MSGGAVLCTGPRRIHRLPFYVEQRVSQAASPTRVRALGQQDEWHKPQTVIKPERNPPEMASKPYPQPSH